jgi:hypothetical protein
MSSPPFSNQSRPPVPRRNAVGDVHHAPRPPAPPPPVRSPRGVTVLEVPEEKKEETKQQEQETKQEETKQHEEEKENGGEEEECEEEEYEEEEYEEEEGKDFRQEDSVVVAASLRLNLQNDVGIALPPVPVRSPRRTLPMDCLVEPVVVPPIDCGHNEEEECDEQNGTCEEENECVDGNDDEDVEYGVDSLSSGALSNSGVVPPLPVRSPRSAEGCFTFSILSNRIVDVNDDLASHHSSSRLNLQNDAIIAAPPVPMRSPRGVTQERDDVVHSFFVAPRNNNNNNNNHNNHNISMNHNNDDILENDSSFRSSEQTKQLEKTILILTAKLEQEKASAKLRETELMKKIKEDGEQIRDLKKQLAAKY